MKKLVLAPYTGASIELFHRLRADGKQVFGFFDNSEQLSDQLYADALLYRPFYAPDIQVILCVPEGSVRKEIVAQLLGLGYRDEDLLFFENVQTKTNLIRVLDDIDLKRAASLMPQRIAAFSARIRKKLRLRELGAPGEDADYTAFDGNAQGFYREKIFRGKKGELCLAPKQITMYVTDKCSLRCKACAAGKQFFRPEEAKNISVESVLQDFEKTMQLIDWVDFLSILGGEPLLRNDLDEIIDGIASHPLARNIGRIWVITNGTITPRENILQALARHSNVEVLISNYREKSVHIAELVEGLSRHGISYSVLDLPVWSDTCQLVQDREEQSAEVLLARRRNDCVCQCNLVSEGRFYLCDLINTMARLHNVPNLRGASVDIYDPDAKEKIAKLVSFEEPLPAACSWCNGCSEEAWNHHLIPVAEQVAQAIETKRYGKDLY